MLTPKIDIIDLRISQIETTTLSGDPTYLPGPTTLDARLTLGKISGVFSGKLTPDEEFALDDLLTRIAARIEQELATDD
jgi:hypothetical protein